MKKFYNRNFAYGAAALLIGAVSFTACSSEDELSNTNPTYDGESVKHSLQLIFLQQLRRG